MTWLESFERETPPVSTAASSLFSKSPQAAKRGQLFWPQCRQEMVAGSWRRECADLCWTTRFKWKRLVIGLYLGWIGVAQSWTLCSENGHLRNFFSSTNKKGRSTAPMVLRRTSYHWYCNKQPVVKNDLDREEVIALLGWQYAIAIFCWFSFVVSLKLASCMYAKVDFRKNGY